MVAAAHIAEYPALNLNHLWIGRAILFTKVGWVLRIGPIVGTLSKSWSWGADLIQYPTDIRGEAMSRTTTDGLVLEAKSVATRAVLGPAA